MRGDGRTAAHYHQKEEITARPLPRVAKHQAESKVKKDILDHNERLRVKEQALASSDEKAPTAQKKVGKVGKSDVGKKEKKMGTEVGKEVEKAKPPSSKSKGILSAPKSDGSRSGQVEAKAETSGTNSGKKKSRIHIL